MNKRDHPSDREISADFFVEGLRKYLEGENYDGIHSNETSGTFMGVHFDFGVGEADRDGYHDLSVLVHFVGKSGEAEKFRRNMEDRAFNPEFWRTSTLFRLVELRKQYDGVIKDLQSVALEEGGYRITGKVDGLKPDNALEAMKNLVARPVWLYRSRIG